MSDVTLRDHMDSQFDALKREMTLLFTAERTTREQGAEAVKLALDKQEVEYARRLREFEAWKTATQENMAITRARWAMLVTGGNILINALMLFILKVVFKV